MRRASSADLRMRLDSRLGEFEEVVASLSVTGDFRDVWRFFGFGVAVTGLNPLTALLTFV